MGQIRSRTGAGLIAAALLAITPAAPAAEKSGKAWVSKHPGSAKVEDLDKDFRPKVEEFVKAAKDAGATVNITSTLRPKRRAYLMHWSWRIAKKDFDAKEVPAMAGVDVDWWHGSQRRRARRRRRWWTATGRAG
jgi:hypothetical protein